MSTLAEDIRKLTLLKKREAILKRRVKDSTKNRAAWERAVFDRMVDEGWTLNESTLALEGVMYKPSSTTFATIQDKNALLEYLQDHDDILVEPKIKEADLNQLVRECLDNGQPLPPGLGYYDKEFISTSGLTALLKGDTATQEDGPDEGQ